MSLTPEQDKLVDMFFAPIKNAIFDSDQDKLLMTKNYEILESESGKNLLDARLFDAKALCAFFDELYQQEDLFYPSDVEIGLDTFTTRLYAMRCFLERNSRSLEDYNTLLYGVKILNTALSKLDAHVVRLEFCPVRLLIDDWGLMSKKLSTMQVRTVIYRFCQQREVSKQELIGAMTGAKEKWGKNVG